MNGSHRLRNLVIIYSVNGSSILFFLCIAGKLQLKTVQILNEKVFSSLHENIWYWQFQYFLNLYSDLFYAAENLG